MPIWNASTSSTCMTRTTRIARKEFKEMFRDGRLRWGAAIVFLLLAVSIFTGWKHFADSSRQREHAKQDERQRWLDQGRKNPHSAAHYGVYAFKPELLLSSVDQGLNSYLGVAVWLEAHRQNLFRFRPAEDATAAARFGELTAAITLQTLIPLLIILLLHSAFTSEREQGTLRLLASLGVPSRRLAFGKALGASAVLGALLIPAALLGAAAMMIYSGETVIGSGFGRYLIMALSYLLYYSIFIAASLIVSAKVKTSQFALIVLLAGWFFNCFVAPRVVTDLAGKLRPTPSAMHMTANIERDLEQGLDGHSSRGARVEELKARTLKQYGVDSIEKLPINFSGVQLTEADEYGYKVYDRHLNALFATYEWQNRFYQHASILSPMLSVQSISMGLAGTDFAQHRDFTDKAEQYRRRIQRRMSDAITSKSGTGDYVMAGNELWQEIPPFEYSAPGLRWTLGNYRWSLLFLALWSAAIWLSLPFAASRVKPD
jgi:ABC-2 type transport system permease protein